MGTGSTDPNRGRPQGPAGGGSEDATRLVGLHHRRRASPLPVRPAGRLGLGPRAYVASRVHTSALTLWVLPPNLQRLLRGEERRIK